MTPTLFGTGKCTITVPEQSGLENAKFNNLNIDGGMNREVLVDIEITGMHYQEHAAPVRSMRE